MDRRLAGFREMRRLSGDSGAQGGEIVIRQLVTQLLGQARRMVQSALASPGGKAARSARWTLPSKLT